MSKKILVLLGHPRVASYCGELARVYVHAARQAGATVTYVKLIDLHFDAVGAHDYRGAPGLERDLRRMQKLILWAEHLVFVYPTWWGGPPALLKGFLDRVIGPGFAFNYALNGLWWTRLLKGRSARLITTTGGPWLLNHIAYHSPGLKMLKWAVFWFAGIWPVRVTEFNSLDTAWMTNKKRKRFIAHVKKIGERDAR